MNVSGVLFAADIRRDSFIFLKEIYRNSVNSLIFLQKNLLINIAAWQITITEQKFLPFRKRKTMTAFFGTTDALHIPQDLFNVQHILFGHG